MRALRGSIGNRASFLPIGVSRYSPSSPSVRAPSSFSSRYPSRTIDDSGGSMNGKPLTSPNLRSVICKITDARLVRRISGSVNSGRSAWSPSSHKRIQTPGATRPHRPARCAADACEISSIGSRCTFNRREYRLVRAVPVSMTARTPGTVIDVSATLVASTIRRPG